MTDKVKMVTSRMVVPYVYLFKAAQFALERAESGKDNPFFDCMSTILFSAFSMEAYLNHIGRAYFLKWEENFECLKPKAKLGLISQERMRASVDFSCRPFQSFNELFNFRNKLAHGKTEKVSLVSHQEITEYPLQPFTKWEKLCTLETTKRLYDDTQKMIRILHFNTPDKKDPFSIYNVSSTEIVKDDEPQDDFPPMTPEDFIY